MLLKLVTNSNKNSAKKIENCKHSNLGGKRTSPRPHQERHAFWVVANFDETRNGDGIVEF